VPNLLEPNSYDVVTDEEGTIVELDIIQHPMFPDFKVYHLKVETEFNNIWADCFVIHPDSYKEYNQRLNELSEAARARRQPWSSFWALKNEHFHDIRPCHAITAHRSQGSTYRAAFVDVSDILANYNKTEAMRCLYVAATRASKILVLKVR
jgi:exodeoxyribonuclease-5